MHIKIEAITITPIIFDLIWSWRISDGYTRRHIAFSTGFTWRAEKNENSLSAAGRHDYRMVT